MCVKSATKEMLPFIASVSPLFKGKISRQHLEFMANKIIDGDMDLEKMNRWLGYIQGVLCATGVSCVEDIAKITAPHFKPKQI